MKEFLIFSILALVSTFAYSQCDREQDSLTLVAIHTSLGGDDWRIPWDLTAPFSTWSGVTTSAAGCVTILDLDGNPDGAASTVGGNLLFGSIPPEIGDFSFLRHLYINGDRVQGSMPDEITQLTSLRTLYITDTELSGDCLLYTSPSPRDRG